MLSVVRKSQNSSGGFYRSRQRSTHDRCRANAIRFLMSAPLALPAPLLIHALRQTSLDALDYVAVSVSSAMLAWAIWVVPVVAGGQSTSENLALACVSCSLRKGARLITVDPYTGEEVVLFDPRRDAWRLHFRWDGVRVVGITPTVRRRIICESFSAIYEWWRISLCSNIV